MTLNTASPPFTIGMVLFPDLTQLDLTGPYEVFARVPQTTVTLVAETMQPVRSERGLTILPDTTFAAAPLFDLLFVPGGIGVNAMMEHTPLLHFLRVQAENARYVTAVCTGALLLGAAGLLRGYRAATHWRSMDLLPLLDAEPVEQRVVVDRNRITGGGITAGIDFGLVVAAEVCGPAVAQRIQLVMEYNPQPPFTGGSPATADPAVLEAVIAITQANQDTRRAIAERVADRLRER
ncbi:MAG: DJ-1/PfpI family protein [Chloroflexales bacterium]|nr:DJ-1/PfpI family protein [Chloroflexales bacterium]